MIFIKFLLKNRFLLDTTLDSWKKWHYYAPLQCRRWLAVHTQAIRHHTLKTTAWRQLTDSSCVDRGKKERQLYTAVFPFFPWPLQGCLKLWLLVHVVVMFSVWGLISWVCSAVQHIFLTSNYIWSSISGTPTPRDLRLVYKSSSVPKLAPHLPIPGITLQRHLWHILSHFLNV